jgi:hypothetical protein
MSQSHSFKGYLPTTTFVMAKVQPRSLPKTQSQPHTAISSIPNHIQLIFLESSHTLHGDSETLLTKMIEAMSVKPESVFVSNLNATHGILPDASERIFVALGEPAAQQILNTSLPLSELRARVHVLPGGNRFIATFHPDYLLKNPQAKKEAWEDLKLAMRELTVPARLS